MPDSFPRYRFDEDGVLMIQRQPGDVWMEANPHEQFLYNEQERYLICPSE